MEAARVSPQKQDTYASGCFALYRAVATLLADGKNATPSLVLISMQSFLVKTASAIWFAI
jgi:hypothetical protein